MKNSFLSLILSGFLTTSLAYGQSNIAAVEISVVEQFATQSVLLVSGTVISREDAAIASELSGRITWVAEVGDEVELGDVLATTDDHLLRLRLQNNKAQMSLYQANLDWNDRQIRRLKKLANQNNTAASELDEIESRRAMLREELRMASIERDRTNYDIERSKVHAPFSGIIVSRETNNGEYTVPGRQLLRLVNTDLLEISAMAPLRIARHSEHGQDVLVTSEEQQIVTPIRKLVPVADSASHMMEVRVSLTQGQWFIGEAVTVELSDGISAKALNVPRDALVLRNNAVYVFAVDDNNVARKTLVTIGTGTGNVISVTGDIVVGDRVVVRGAERLTDGQTVRIIKRNIASR